jgi:hypothetical protein
MSDDTINSILTNLQNYQKKLAICWQLNTDSVDRKTSTQRGKGAKGRKGKKSKEEKG